MLSELANLDDFASLIERGYSLSIVDAYLIVNDVPYLNKAGELERGRLAAALHQPTPQMLGAPFNHQMYWSGSYPYFLDGSKISVANIEANVMLAGHEFKQHLSNKPVEGFATYSALVEHYVTLISAPASERFGATPLTGAQYNVPAENSAFKIRDTFSAKAEITDLNQNLMADRIAIIGLGSTGAFVLDFIAKTPVHSIDAFDFDVLRRTTPFVHLGKSAPTILGWQKRVFTSASTRHFGIV